MTAVLSPTVRPSNPGALLSRGDLAALGWTRTAVDAIFRRLPVVQLEGLRKPMVRVSLVRASVSKTRRPRLVDIPADLLAVVLDRLPAYEDRDPAAPLFGVGVTGDRLRTAIGRACRDTGVSTFSPHALRHRRISLLHRQGESWAPIGERMGQRSKLVTADTYTHALIDSREVDRAKLLQRAAAVHTPVHTSAAAGTFGGQAGPFCSRPAPISAAGVWPLVGDCDLLLTSAVIEKRGGE